MANFNKVILVGRLTRDPETRAFNTGGMVAKIGFAVTNRRKNGQTGQWEDEPMFIDCEVFNRGETGKLADLVRDRCRKGSQIMIEGKLHLDTWQDKTTGQNRTKHKIVVDNIQLLDPRQDGGMGGGGGMGIEEGGYGGGGGGGGGGRGLPPARGPAKPPAKAGGYSAGTDDDPGDDFPHDGGAGGKGDEIPF